MARPQGVVEPSMAETSVATYTGSLSSHGWYESVSATAVFKTGHQYVGAWKGGKMHGRGVYEWVDGVVFEGYFSNNVAEGFGRYAWPDGGVYSGQVRNGKRDGPGVMTFVDGDTTYDGSWKQGMRHGKGRIDFCASASGAEHFYYGDWRGDKKHGTGSFVYRNGDSYCGEWRNDVKHGKGVYRWVGDGRDERYEGNFVHGNAHGHGTHVWFLSGDDDEKKDSTQTKSNHNVNAYAKDKTSSVRFSTNTNTYVGAFDNGRRHGKGTFYYADGSRYVGGFVDNQKHGTGKFTFDDGSVFCGLFLNDRPVVTPGDPIFAPTTHIHLKVDDLFEPGTGCATKAEQNVELDKTILRLMSELRKAYAMAAASSVQNQNQNHGARPHRKPKTVSLTIGAFVLWARRVGITGVGFTVCQLARCVAPAWREEGEYEYDHEYEYESVSGNANVEHAVDVKPQLACEASDATTLDSNFRDGFFLNPTSEKRSYINTGERLLPMNTSESAHPADPVDPPVVPPLLDPNTVLVFREFCEALVRCAAQKFSQTPNLAERVERLLCEFAFANPTSLAWDVALRGGTEDLPEHQVLRTKQDAQMHTFFLQAVRTHPRDVTKRRDPLSVDGRSFLAFLRKKHLLVDALDDQGEELVYPPVEAEVTPEEEDEEPPADETPAGETVDETADETAEQEQTPEEEVEHIGSTLTSFAALAAFAAAVAPFDAIAEAAALEEEQEAEAEAAAEAFAVAEQAKYAKREALAKQFGAARVSFEARKAEAEENGESAAFTDELTDENWEEEFAAAAAKEEAAAAEAAALETALKLDTQTMKLSTALDCEATFLEFQEALARCALLAAPQAETLVEKLDAFLQDLESR